MPTLYLSADDIERSYGSGNFDDAADTLAAWLAGHGIHSVRFDIDSTHPNPWFHALCVELPVVDPALLQHFYAWLAQENIEILKVTP
ncbi:hypothetical protein L1281_001595 [Neisseria sp. HSC-16F19]|nr:hypothetical protein [Neisseria sp. HSC-16F19]MCP2041005.1 hypothetical protein [Neisseria sp. HSC-16F19]